MKNLAILICRLKIFGLLFCSVLVSNVLNSQKPNNFQNLIIEKSAPLETFKNGSITFRSKDKILFSQTGLNIEVPGLTNKDKAYYYADLIKNTLGLNDDNNLIYTVTKSDLGFNIYRFYQQYKSLKVDNNQLTFTFNINSRISSIINSSIPINSNFGIEPSIKPEEAKEIFIKYLKPEGKLIHFECDLMIHVINFIPFLSYKVSIIANKPTGDWNGYIDALSGEILEVLDISTNANGRCLIFYPDPISSTRGTYGSGGMVDNGDATNSDLNNARVEMDLLDITYSNGQYSLVGPKAQIVDIELPFNGLFFQSSSDFFFTRADDGFEAAMCYFYIDNNMRYIHGDLDYGFIAPTDNGGVKFDPHGYDGADNSHYLPDVESLTFGEGGVDDAEDPDVIIHELGHAIHDFVTGGMDDFSQTQGLSEGFSDYWAVSFSNSLRLYKEYESQHNFVFKWDGHNDFWSGRTTAQTVGYNQINTLDYPHGQGTIFSTVLIKIQNDIGRFKADKAILKGMASTITGTNQPSAAEFIYQAAVDLSYSDEDLCIIYKHFFDTYGSNFDPNSNPPSSTDTYMKDDYKDFGEEVNTLSSILYLSEDIWVRNIDDNGFIHQNPEYKTSGSNYVYVRIRGRGCDPLENGVLHLYWSKASTGLKWPYSWTYNPMDANTCVIPTSGGNRPCGMEIGSGQAIPELDAGEEAIIKFAWAPPNPLWYDDLDKHHYCLYSRIVANDDLMHTTETDVVWSNTANNNNIAWKNISVFDLDPNNIVNDTISVYVVDVDNTSGAVSLGLINSDKPHYGSVLDNGNLYITLREPLYTIWENGGKQGMGFSETEDNRLLVTSMSCRISNLVLDSLEYYLVDFAFEGDSVINPFAFDFIQVNALNQKIGGEQFLYAGSDSATALPRSSHPNNDQKETFTLYPNPSNSYFIVKIVQPTNNLAISIYDINGKTILSQDQVMAKSLNEISIDWPSNLNPGIYFIKLKTEKESKVFKIIKN